MGQDPRVPASTQSSSALSAAFRTCFRFFTHCTSYHLRYPAFHIAVLIRPHIRQAIAKQNDCRPQHAQITLQLRRTDPDSEYTAT